MELIPTVTNPDNVIVSRAKDLCEEMGLEKAYLHREIDENNKSHYMLFKPWQIFLDVYSETKTVRSIVLVQWLIYGEYGKPVYEAGVFYKPPGKGLHFNREAIDAKSLIVIGSLVCHNLTRDM